MRRLVVLLSLCSSACILPVQSAPPGEFVVRLAPEDRALLENLVRHAAVGEPEHALEPLERVPSRESAPLPRDSMRLVTEGPIAMASYNSGAPLYNGVQVLHEGRWVRDGAWRAWHADGNPWEEGAYRRGEEHGPWRWWYEGGTLQAQGTFDEGLHTGAWTYYHPNGEVLAAGRYERGRPVGRWVTFDEHGNLLSEREH
jgi:hypothetical protein